MSGGEHQALENYLDLLKPLPNDIFRNAAWIKALDRKCEDVKDDLHALQERVIRKAGEGEAPTVQAADLKEIRKKQVEVFNLCVEKVLLTEQARDIIMGFRDRLDEDILRIEHELGPEGIAALNAAEEAANAKPGEAEKKVPDKRKQRSYDAMATTAGPEDEGDEWDEWAQQEAEAAETMMPVPTQETQSGTGPPASSYPPPVPKLNKQGEQLFCLCRQVSYGQMIGCDNENCPYEWFHFHCVGVKMQPKANEKWYCAVCAPQMKGQQQ